MAQLFGVRHDGRKGSARPRPELYDLRADTGGGTNLYNEGRPPPAVALDRELEAITPTFRTSLRRPRRELDQEHPREC